MATTGKSLQEEINQAARHVARLQKAWKLADSSDQSREIDWELNAAKSRLEELQRELDGTALLGLLEVRIDTGADWGQREWDVALMVLRGIVMAQGGKLTSVRVEGKEWAGLL